MAQRWVFRFAAGMRTNVGGQKSEVGMRKATGAERKTEFGKQMPTVGSWRTETFEFGFRPALVRRFVQTTFV